jgi:hypothetical protein
MKKIECYLEASSLWNMFYGEPGVNLVEYCIESPEISCMSSVWSHLELHRGVQKRINQKEITSAEGSDLRTFMDVHIDRLVARKQLLELEVTKELIDQAKRLIASHNLFASDALHLVSAISSECSCILVDDYHFTRLNKQVRDAIDISIIHTSMTIKKMNDILAKFEPH